MAHKLFFHIFFRAIKKRIGDTDNIYPESLKYLLFVLLLKKSIDSCSIPDLNKTKQNRAKQNKILMSRTSWEFPQPYKMCLQRIYN